MKQLMILAASIFFLNSGTAYAKSATASLEGIGSSTWTSGTVTFREENGGLRIKVTVKSVNPGKHGFHIHENGSCEKAGAAAGNHFNPGEAPHGHISRDGFAGAHAGDLGNLEVISDGTGSMELFVPGLSLSEGDHNVLGRSVILHEKEDDFSQPVGNSGGRIACGVIK